MQREWNDSVNRILSRLRRPSVHVLRRAQADAIIGYTSFSVDSSPSEQPHRQPTKLDHLLSVMLLLLCIALICGMGGITKRLLDLCDTIGAPGGCPNPCSNHNSLRSSLRTCTNFSPLDQPSFGLCGRVTHGSSRRNALFLPLARHTFLGPFLGNWQLSLLCTDTEVLVF